ncbi:uncharacterized protein cubi_02233 [Cryptosporidium ubiquitum]|uniref:ER membrane protein complex subunit 4 n=1 Tax=Cryptosporidium ubiquitum TaxID=857276 RepID=A0A1J4MFG5_9CRYT|nr:uncharacterized protein cubi_02233 [Cryptosporidium ubiquitum]OII73002.1 hypothetical protein cubi_02233 [Cryptosporidium ubiquitum]
MQAKTVNQSEPKGNFDKEMSKSPNVKSKYDTWILHPKQIEKIFDKNPLKQALIGSSNCDSVNQSRVTSCSSYTHPTSSSNPKRKHQDPRLSANKDTETQSTSTQNTTEMCNFDKKAWNIAHLPLKTMGMTFLMLYMSGNNAGIFSILIVSYALVNAVKILIQANKNFLEIERAARKSFAIQKTVYCIYSLLGIAFILFKLGTMGLIPVNRGDFFSDTPSHTFPAYAIGT